MSVEFRVISIGALSHHRLWGEPAPVRTAHATCTYVTAGEKRILVDPSLPATALNARFGERTGQDLGHVTDVFCTTLRPAHRRALPALTEARWWAWAPELDAYRGHLEQLAETAARAESADAEAVREELKLLERFEPAPDELADRVELFPLAGASPGSAGLLLTPPSRTLVIAGDIVLTREHLLGGQVWKGCVDTETAMSSLQDILELADLIVPGHDNILPAPARWV